MNISEALQVKKKDILSVWIERTLESYSSSGFFKKSRDIIANPIGTAIRQGFADILDLLLAEQASEKYDKPLDQVVRMRAVQDFSPSQAVVPFLELKWVIRQVLSDDKKTVHLIHELSRLDCEIDRLALTAFDKYMECREQLFQTRIKELKSGSYILTDSPCASSQLRKVRGHSGKIN